ncbi:MAG: hypothetical protein WBO23_15375 [Burkholderiales bacterium]
MRYRVLACASLIALAGCHFQADAPGEAPAGVTAVAGDGRAVVSFDPQPDLTYWIFYQPGSSVASVSPGVPILRGAVSPQVVANLANGTQYAFVMNATRDDSSAGPSSAIVTAIPRLAGASWVSGAALGALPQNLNGLAFNGTRLVAVGNSAAVFAGDYHYASTTPPGVTAWLPPTAFPAGFASNLSSVIYSGQFISLGANGSILTSADGLSWTLTANLIPSTGMNSIVFAAPFYVAVGNGGKIFTSTDLAAWAQPASNTIEDLYSIAFLNGRLIATGANGTLLTSADAAAWSAQVSNAPNALRGAAFAALTSGPQYVVVGDAGTIVTSSDAVTWSPIAPPLAANLSTVVFGSRFVAVGQGGAAAYSDDGLSWTQTTAGSTDLASVLFTPGMYIAVGAAGANVVSK